MDNQPENDIDVSTSDNQPEPEDLQIDTQNFDLDFLSEKIQKSVESKKDETKYDETSENNQLDPFMSLQEPKHTPLPEAHVETSVKKYVIHVEPENIDYMEHLTVNERRVVINKILKDQSIYTKEELKKAKNKKIATHTLIMIITFSIFLPLFFMAITTAAKLTFDTYAASKSNFSKLYRENGVIKKQR